MIELVVVMGIIMILTGLLLPVIASGRGAATDVSQASALRQIGLVSEMYCADWDDMYAVADTRLDFRLLSLDDGASGQAVIGRAWPNALLDAGVIEQEVLVELLKRSQVLWSRTMYINPGQLDPDRILPWEQVTASGVRRASVQYPSSKGLLGVETTYAGEHRVLWALAGVVDAPVFAADGSIHQMCFADLLRPTPPPMLGWGIPIQTTWHGVRGRDW